MELSALSVMARGVRRRILRAAGARRTVPPPRTGLETPAPGCVSSGERWLAAGRARLGFGGFASIASKGNLGGEEQGQGTGGGRRRSARGGAAAARPGSRGEDRRAAQ